MPRSLQTSVETLSPAEAQSAIDVLRLSFAADPLIRWLFPESHRYLRWFPEFVRRYGGRAFQAGTADAVGNNEGVALWLEPTVTPENERVAELLEAVVPDDRRPYLWRLAHRLMESTPVEPYWHLVFLGVDPHAQRQGLGSKLLEHGLKRVDANGDIAYIETATSENLSMYTNHGFQLIDVVSTEDGPPVYTMARDPGGVNPHR